MNDNSIISNNDNFNRYVSTIRPSSNFSSSNSSSSNAHQRSCLVLPGHVYLLPPPDVCNVNNDNNDDNNNFFLQFNDKPELLPVGVDFRKFLPDKETQILVGTELKDTSLILLNKEEGNTASNYPSAVLHLAKGFHKIKFYSQPRQMQSNATISNNEPTDAVAKTFIDELEVHVDDSDVTYVSSLPALTSSHSVTSNNSSTNTILDEPHISSNSVLTTGSKDSLLPPKLNRPNSFDDALFSNKHLDGDIIDVSIADFDSDLKPKHFPSSDFLSSGSKSQSAVGLKQKRTLYKFPFHPNRVSSQSHIRATLSCTDLGASDVKPLNYCIDKDASSVSLPVTKSEGKKRHLLHDIRRKKFLLKPQHIPKYEPNEASLEYTSDIPDIYALGVSPTMTEETARKIRKRVASHPPPLLPDHLESTFINASAKASKEDQCVLPRPSHVVLNHLATSSIKHEMLAVAATTRYREDRKSVV